MLAARVLLGALLGASLVSVALADDFKSEHVAHLTNSNFEELVGDGKVYFIKFYAPWCGHCKRLAGAWKTLGENFAGSDKVAIAHVDCTTDRDICTNAEVRGYPTLKVFHQGIEYKAYKGPRDVESLRKFVEDAAADLLKESS